MKKLLISLAVFMVAGFSLSSCLKDSKSPEAGFAVTEIGVNATQLLETPLDIFLQADRAIRFQRDSIIYKGVNQSSLSFNMGYIKLTVTPADTVTYPKTVTLDFGSDNTKSYQGKMVLVMNGNMRNSGSKCAISYLSLLTGNSTITGTDTIISSGKNASGSIVSRYNMHGGQLNGYNDKRITYDGRVIAKFNLTSGANVLDSVELNATDGNAVGYKLYSVNTYKLQVPKACNYFNTGIIASDIKIGGVLVGNYVYDYSYSSTGTVDYCDSDGSIYVYSKLNPKYQQQFAFVAKKFE